MMNASQSPTRSRKVLAVAFAVLLACLLWAVTPFGFSKAEAAPAETASLEQARQDLALAQAAYDQAETDYEDAKAALDALEQAAASADARTSLDFFEHVGATNALEDIRNAPYASYTAAGDPDDATSLQNMRQSVKWLYRLNEIRRSVGLSELLVDDSHMAWAQSNANFSNVNIGHASQFWCGENLAWNWNPSLAADGCFIQWYTNEKVIFDDAVDAMSGNVVTWEEGSFAVTDAQADTLRGIRASGTVTNDELRAVSQMDGSFYSAVGHYLNIVNSSYVVTGFAINSMGAKYAYTYSNTFGLVPDDDTFTVAQYEQRLEDFMSSAGGGSDEIDAAKQEVERAKAALDSAAQDLDAAQQAYDSAQQAAGGTPVTEIFPDVRDDWYTSEVQWAYDNGLMGQGIDLFGVGTNLSRAEFAAVLARLAGVPGSELSSKVDTTGKLDLEAGGQWYTGACNWAVANGFIGQGGDRFNPGEPVSREMAATILCRYAAANGVDTTPSYGGVSAMPDWDSASPWAQPSLAWAYEAGVMTGSNGQLLPLRNVLREEICKMVHKTSDAIDS